jgi:hypothetical protein
LRRALQSSYCFLTLKFRISNHRGETDIVLQFILALIANTHQAKLRQKYAEFRYFFVALFSPLGYKVRQAAPGALTPDAALTTNHLLQKGDLWLFTRVIVPARDAQGSSRKSLAKSWMTWNCLSPRITAPCISGFKTRRHSPSIFSRASGSLLHWRTGKPEIADCSNSGGLFTASTNSHAKPYRPAIRRVLFSVTPRAGGGVC